MAPNDYKTTTDWAVATLSGTYGSIDELAKALHRAGTSCRIIGGNTVSALPLGYEAQVTVVPVTMSDVYEQTGSANDDAGPPRTGGTRPLNWKGHLIWTIANAFGVEFTDIDRLDDRKHPHFAEVRVHGRYKQLDGTWRPIKQAARLDFRDGADHGCSPKQLPKKRRDIYKLVITSAQLTACRKLFGIGFGCQPDELDRPFVVVRPVFTGRVPGASARIQEMFAATVCQRELMAAGAVFGPMAAPMQLGPSAAAAQSTNLLSFDADAAGELDQGGGDDATVESEPPPPPPAAPPRTNGNGGAARGDAVWRAPFGNNRGMTAAEMSERDLDWWHDRLQKDLRDPEKKQYAANIRAGLLAVETERTRRHKAETPLASPEDDGRGGYGSEPEYPT